MFPKTNNRKPFSFSKAEKLTGKTTIDLLFSEGHSVYRFPIKFYYYFLPNYTLDSDELPLVMVSVSKKHFKHAVDRNYIKRQLREIYRSNKAEWWALFPNKPAYIAFLYTTPKKLSLDQLKKKVYLAIEMAAAAQASKSQS